MAKAISLSALLLVASPALADSESFLEIGAVAMCESSASVGFYWEKGAYHKTSFKGTKHLFRKAPPSECLGQEGFGEEDHSKEGFVFKSSKICIKYSEFGEEAPEVGGACNEYILRRTGGTLEHTVSCDGKILTPYVYFSLNGYYHMTHINGSLEKQPKDDYKDSLSVEWGLCSVISGQ